MKYSLILAAAPVIAFGIAAQAHAAEFYVKVDGGLTNDNTLSASGTSIDLGSGDTYSAGGGVDFGPIRIEGEARHLDAKTSLFGLNVDGTGTLYGANLFLEPIALGKVEPFVQAGVGKLDGKLNTAFGSVSANGLAFSYGGGAGYKVSDTLTLDASWRHIQADDLNGVSLKTDAFLLGARIKLA